MLTDKQAQFLNQVISWYEEQKREGMYACMGNCATCGFHACHKCLCWMLDYIKE